MSAQTDSQQEDGHFVSADGRPAVAASLYRQNFIIDLSQPNQ
jgi:hypothetical protein